MRCFIIFGQFFRQGTDLAAQNMPAAYSNLPRPPSAYPNGIRLSPNNLHPNSAAPLYGPQINANQSSQFEPVILQRDGSIRPSNTGQQVTGTTTEPSAVAQHPSRAPSPAYTLAMIDARIRATLNAYTATPRQSSGDGRLRVAQASQGWRPSGRMRGSLQGQAYSDALNEFIIQPARASEQSRRFMSSSSNAPQLRGLSCVANAQNIGHTQAQPSQGAAANHLPVSSSGYPNYYKR